MSDDLVKRLTIRLQEIYDRPHDFSNGQKSEAAGLARDRIEELEAKLAKAVDALQGLVPILCEGFEDGCGKLSRHDCAACEGYATIAELTGDRDE